jgi:hypothetical protein
MWGMSVGLAIMVVEVNVEALNNPGSPRFPHFTWGSDTARWQPALGYGTVYSVGMMGIDGDSD